MENGVRFLEELMDQVIKDYQTPKISAEVSISTILSIFIEDLINHKDIINLIYEGDFQGQHFKFYSKEFPIKKDSNYQSDNMDYLFINNTTMLITELKTSGNSFDPNQEQYKNYKKLKQKIEMDKKSAGFLIDELKSISKRSPEKLKYYSTYPFLLDEVMENIEKDKFNNINKAEIIYIAPESIEANFSFNEPVKFISFRQLSKIELPEGIYGKYKSEAWKIISKYCLEIEKLNSKYY